jgi:hypothetical protein
MANPSSLSGRPDISPYRNLVSEQKRLLYLVSDRLKWDLTHAARHSRKRLALEKDKHRGQKAVIICNGPSLLNVDLTRFGGVYTFGLNKINLLFSKSNFRPSSIVSVNRLVLEQNAGFFNSTDITLYLANRAADIIKCRDTVRYLHLITSPRFARDISGSVNEGATVTFVALQVAFHLGFETVGLVGCDHNFATKGPANQTVIGHGADNSHFDPNYFAHGVPWQLPDLEESENNYRLARFAYENSGRKILNCTVGGKLDVFPRCSLDEFLEKK